MLVFRDGEHKTVYADANFKSDPDERASISVYVFTFNGGTIY